MLNTLENLFNLARERKKYPIDGSYTNKLLSNKSLSKEKVLEEINELIDCLLYTSPSPRDMRRSRMPSSA